MLRSVSLGAGDLCTHIIKGRLTRAGHNVMIAPVPVQ